METLNGCLQYSKASLFLSACQPISNLMLASTNSRVNSKFSRAIYWNSCAWHASLLACLWLILVSLLACISNTLRVYSRVVRVHYSARSKYLAGMVIIIMKLLLLNRVKRIWLLSMLCVRWITHITFTTES